MLSHLPRAITLFVLASSIAASSAQAGDYPSSPVKIIAPFGAGGPTDVYTRDIAEELRKALHQTFYIENRPGAGTTIGTDMVAKADPDGYTLLMVSGTLVEHPSVPAKNLAELLALARAKPGTLNFGSSGPGSNYHMAAELLKNLTGIDIVHVPYKGSTGMRSDILSGQIQLLFDSVPTMAPLINSGMVRALGTSGTTRSATLPDVPTIAEAGVPDFHATLWVGFMAPARTPQPIVDLLNRTIIEILQRPDIKAAWEKQGATPLVMSQLEFQNFMAAEILKWAKVIKDNHIAMIQ